jgi:hypothetical protein
LAFFSFQLFLFSHVPDFENIHHGVERILTRPEPDGKTKNVRELILAPESRGRRSVAVLFMRLVYGFWILVWFGSLYFGFGVNFSFGLCVVFSA